MKRNATCIAAVALMWLGMAGVANAANDRRITAVFIGGTGTQSGGAHVTLQLAVTNGINNLQFPSHFIQWVQVTIPAGFTGSGANGAFQTSDFVPPGGWRVSSISGRVITFIS